MGDSNEQAILEAKIDEKAPELVRRVIAFSDKNAGRIANSGKNGKKQFNDIMEAAGQACCVEEFCLYVSYKGSKEGTKPMWGDLADPFNKEVAALRQLARAFYPSGADERTIEKAHLELLKRFTGYLMWKANVMIENQKSKTG
jgi:hypothetical protein